MKIIDAPDVKAWTKRCTCQRCGTTAEVDAGDLRAFRCDSYQRDEPQAVYRCPTCKGEVWIARTAIPDHVWNTLPPRGRA